MVPKLAISIATTTEWLIIQLPQRELTLKWEHCSPLLASATPAQRLNAELSPGAYGIHWPELDEDLSIAGLLQANP